MRSSIAGMTRAELRDLMGYRALRNLPVAAASRIGAALGAGVARRAYPAADARIAALMRRVRPDLAASAKQLEAAQVRFWGHVGRIYAEYCVLPKIMSEDRVTIDDPATLDGVLADGRPVIATFVHLGNWESCGGQLALRAPGRVCGLSNPMPANRVQAQIASAYRARIPAKVLTFDANVWRHALAHLQQPGGILLVPADEQPQGRASIPTLGRTLDSAANVHKIARIAARVGAIILPLFSERLPGARFCTRVLPPLEVPMQRAARADGQELVARLDALYSPVVIALVDQWFGLLDYR
jgi:Kdo2-lipid IVA lauroyltransferase/acyltransferase